MCTDNKGAKALEGKRLELAAQKLVDPWQDLGMHWPWGQKVKGQILTITLELDHILLNNNSILFNNIIHYSLIIHLWPLTSGSVHAEVLPWTIWLLTLVLLVQAVFLLECGQTDKQTDASERPTHAVGYTCTNGGELLNNWIVANSLSKTSLFRPSLK